jgi:hypothetical protein
LLQSKLPSRKRRQRQQRYANNGKKNVLPQLKQHVSKCNARRKLKGTERSARRQNVLLPETQRLPVLRMEMPPQFGDALHPEILHRLCPLVHQPSRRPGPKVRHLVNIEHLGAELGGKERQGKQVLLSLRLLDLHPLPLPQSRSEKSYQKTTTASSLSQRRRFGSPNDCSRAGSSCYVHLFDVLMLNFDTILHKYPFSPY